jgi:ectoine hydroxylase-related dioxygenase (phytanoyl-CoA dioxygenase family)
MSTTATTLEAALSSAQIQRYRADGYLLVPDLLTGQEIDAFLEYQRNPKPMPKEGQGLRRHAFDPQYKYLATHPKIVGGARQLLDGRPMIVQTMLLSKAPSGGRGIALHQDTHYLPSDPNTLMACWVALTDTDGDNGGLCIVPGSHLTGLRRAQRNKNESEQVSWEMEYDMRDRDGREYKEKMHSFEIADLDPASIVRLTVPRGTGVFFTGMTIHGSFANKSPDRPRIAFATHYVREGTWLFRRDVQETVPAI